MIGVVSAWEARSLWTLTREDGDHGFQCSEALDANVTRLRSVSTVAEYLGMI